VVQTGRPARGKTAFRCDPLSQLRTRSAGSVTGYRGSVAVTNPLCGTGGTGGPNGAIFPWGRRSEQLLVALAPLFIKDTLAKPALGVTIAGPIHVHPSGKFVYLTNRAGWPNGAARRVRLLKECQSINRPAVARRGAFWFGGGADAAARVGWPPSGFYGGAR
jgi:hypothetical protein